MSADPWINAVGVLNRSTLNVLATKVGRQGVNTVDGWCATNRKQVKAWEKDGSLLERVLAAVKQADDAQRQYETDKASNSWMAALSSHEINELYGGPSGRL